MLYLQYPVTKLEILSMQVLQPSHQSRLQVNQVLSIGSLGARWLSVIFLFT